MSWHARIGPATFRGVPFHVDTSERSGGRRGVTHEFPLRDDSYREDLGRKGRAFQVDGYVVGSDYMTARDALLTVLESEGPGELVHPYYGTLRVAVLTYRVREATSRGGMAEFSIEFEETPAQAVFPTSVPDAPAKVLASALAARAAVSAEFLAQYSPGTLLDSVTEALTSAMDTIDAALAAASMAAQPLATLKARIVDFEDAIEDLVEVPEDLASDLLDLVDLIDSRPVLLALYEFNPGVQPPTTTTNRAQERANFDATQYLIQRAALIRSAELALDETFDSYNAAVTARDALTELLDEQAEIVADDTYPLLMQLRADVVKAIPGDDSDLPKLVAFTPPAAVASLVLAYQLYGSVELEADIVTRNAVRHPGFVPGGRALEVLSDG